MLSFESVAATAKGAFTCIPSSDFSFLGRIEPAAVLR
jgi:hypothetical protein